MRSRLSEWFFGKISIRKKLVISFSLLVSIPIIILGVFVFFQTGNRMVQQAEASMTNDLTRLTVDMTNRFQRENDFIKYQAYNLKLRRMLGSSANSAELAREMNESVEPELWYFITSDMNIKEIQIFTPCVDQPLGTFLEPAEQYESEEWYQWHVDNFKTVWCVEDGRLFARRTITDAETSSYLVGVLQVEFYYNRFMEPFTVMDNLNTGIRVTDADGQIIYEKAVKNQIEETKISNKILEIQNGQKQTGKKYILKREQIPGGEWTVWYYLDRTEIWKENALVIISSLLMVLGCVGVVFFFISLLSKVLSRRILALKNLAENISLGSTEKLPYTTDTDEIGIVTNSLCSMSERLNETLERVYKAEIDKKSAELKALQAMINPHFLYNCLSSVKWKAIRKGDDEISSIIGLIAKFYRTALNNGRQVTSVKNELENIQAYLEIQKATHDNSFDTEYTIEEESLSYSMLNFLLQPIVENAVKHGIDYFEQNEGRGKVRIVFFTEDAYLIFRIFNNGPKIDEEYLKGVFNKRETGYGISNIIERISMYYGGDCGISASIADTGETCFEVKILKEVKNVK